MEISTIPPFSCNLYWNDEEWWSEVDLNIKWYYRWHYNYDIWVYQSVISSAMMNCWDSVGLQVNVVLLSSILLLMNNALLSMVDLSSELNLQSAVQSAVWRVVKYSNVLAHSINENLQSNWFICYVRTHMNVFPVHREDCWATKLLQNRVMNAIRFSNMISRYWSLPVIYVWCFKLNPEFRFPLHGMVPNGISPYMCLLSLRRVVPQCL